ncbi:hypothetical protein O3P69_014414 [Scylla paramamosain]|uniref:Ionotropic glutamate receptor L-glutamate and glycine-binding domain-containing protein n=1 Tax=Scylla paramamosain TaxID=85552 RepID=A0AAW0TC12_SCYPA
MVVQKTSPLLYGIDKCLLTLSENGIKGLWVDSVGNDTACDNVPKKVIITSYISLSNIWGVFAVLGGGLTAGLVVWCVELLVPLSNSHFSHHLSSQFPLALLVALNFPCELSPCKPPLRGTHALRWTMKRHQSRPTSLFERSNFVSMWINGKSARTIARESGVSASTVCRWINRWRQEGNVYNHKPLKSYPYNTFMQADPMNYNTLVKVDAVQAPRGVTVFQAGADGLNDNNTRTHLKETVDDIRQMGEVRHCLVVVVVSDDPAFLAAFAHLSLTRHALRWSTRILVLTRLPLSHLDGLHGLLSTRNAMLLREEEEGGISKAEVYVWQPYSAASSKPLRVATWTTQGGLTLKSRMPLFPDKFYVFTSPPTLSVAVELIPHHTLEWVPDSRAPDGRRLEYTGYADNVVRYFAKAMNFSYRYVVSPERTFGTKLPDGSWTGVVGMLVREEADFVPGPMIVNLVRREATGHTSVYAMQNVRIINGLTGLQVDPWGFLLPLTALVWAATLAALLGDARHSERALLLSAQHCTISSLALMKTNSASLTPNADVSVESGVFREVAELEKKGRLKFHTQAQYLTSLDKLVRAGDHALVDAAISLRSLIALDFSQKGEQDARQFIFRIGRLNAQGLISYWMENVPNFTECDNIPKKMLVTSSISASNIWGVFVLLGGGVVAGLAVWCLEVLVKPCKEH